MRRITKIARVSNEFIGKALRGTGFGTAEFDFIHFIRHHPGVTQTELSEHFSNLDRAAVTRRVQNLEKKGFVRREQHPRDKRSHLLYATQKSENLRNLRADMEELYYDWLAEEISQEEMDAFLRVLEKLYVKSKNERRNQYAVLLELARTEREQAHLLMPD